MKKLNVKTRKGQAQKQETEKQESTPKKERSVLMTLVINGAIALAILVAVILLVNVSLGVLTRHGSNRDVPDLVGMSIPEAEDALKDERLELAISDTLFVPIYKAGVVLEQRPLAGEGKVKAGRKIYVTINADQQRSVEVPYVTGLSLRQAVGDILSVGLEIEKLIYKQDMANKYVLREKVGEKTLKEGEKTTALMASGVTLVVGINGAASESVPNLVGKTLHEAKHLLWSAGFNIGQVTYDAEMSLLDQTDAVIWKQTPAARVSSRLGTEVALELTLDKEKVEK